MAGFYKIYKNTIKIDVTKCKSVEESTRKVQAFINENNVNTKNGEDINVLRK